MWHHGRRGAAVSRFLAGAVMLARKIT
jgi:hypothetical protein